MSYLEEPEEKEHECTVCGVPTEKEGLCNSRACFEADMM
mgnify:CR=1 FL=1